MEERNASYNGKWGHMRVFVFILLLFLKKRAITESLYADEKDPGKGKINDVGQCSANYLTRGPNLAH